MGVLALTFPIILFPPWASVQCRASCTLLVGRRMTILLACLKYDWSSNTRHSEILMSDWGVQMELLPAECYEHRHTSAPIIHAPSPLTDSLLKSSVCVCVRVRIRFEVLKNSQPITLSGELTQINDKRVCKHKNCSNRISNDGNSWKRWFKLRFFPSQTLEIYKCHVVQPKCINIQETKVKKITVPRDPHYDIKMQLFF